MSRRKQRDQKNCMKLKKKEVKNRIGKASQSCWSWKEKSGKTDKVKEKHTWVCLNLGITPNKKEGKKEKGFCL